MNTNNKSKTSRRDFLFTSAKAALFLPALDLVMDSLTKSGMNNALAAAPAKGFKQFIHFNFAGAPPRWAYDSFINPTNEASRFIFNPQVVNRYVGSGSRYLQTDYKLFKHEHSGKWVPWLWAQAIPAGAHGSSLVRAHTLLDNMLSIRGINVLLAAHTGANNFHQSAVAGGVTTNSILADSAQASATNPVTNMIRAVTLNPIAGFSLYKSLHGSESYRFDVGIGATQATTPNSIATMFSAMRPISTANGFAASFVTNKGAVQDKIDAALKTLSPAAGGYHSSIGDSFSKSKKILDGTAVQVFSQLTNEWESLFGKYYTLIEKTLGRTYPGINDKPVGSAADIAATPNHYWAGGDTIFTSAGAGGPDILRTVDNMKFEQLAAQFAVVEFLISYGITPSISMIPATFRELNVNGSNVNFIFDQHFYGPMVSVLWNSLYYLSFTSCLLELIRFMKVKGTFNDTLIYLNGEFERTPIDTMTGSGHATSATVSLISGRIQGFKVIGNIVRDSLGVGTKYMSLASGTWGHHADIDGKPLTIMQVWASILRLQGLPVSELPNIVEKDRLIFNASGDMTVATRYNQAVNILNASKS